MRSRQCSIGAAIGQPEHRKRLELVRRLLAVRTTEIVPRLPRLRPGHGRAALVDGVLAANWSFGSGEALSVLANLGDRTPSRPATISAGPADLGPERCLSNCRPGRSMPR